MCLIVRFSINSVFIKTYANKKKSIKFVQVFLQYIIYYTGYPILNKSANISNAYINSRALTEISEELHSSCKYICEKKNRYITSPSPLYILIVTSNISICRWLFLFPPYPRLNGYNGERANLFAKLARGNSDARKELRSACMTRLFTIHINRLGPSPECGGDYTRRSIISCV